MQQVILKRFSKLDSIGDQFLNDITVYIKTVQIAYFQLYVKWFHAGFDIVRSNGLSLILMRNNQFLIFKLNLQEKKIFFFRFLPVISYLKF